MTFHPWLTKPHRFDHTWNRTAIAYRRRNS